MEKSGHSQEDAIPEAREHKRTEVICDDPLDG
jgi:hypothetical protein